MEVGDLYLVAQPAAADRLTNGPLRPNFHGSGHPVET